MAPAWICPSFAVHAWWRSAPIVVANAPRTGYNGPVVDLAWKILAIVGLIALNGYFVASEFAAVTARVGRLKPLAKTSLMARAALRVKGRLDLYLSACQLGTSLATLALGAVTEPAIGSLVEPLTRALHLGHGRRPGWWTTRSASPSAWGCTSSSASRPRRT